MACKGCIDAVDIDESGSKKFIWNGAMMKVVGCDRHKKEVLEVLSRNKKYEGSI